MAKKFQVRHVDDRLVALAVTLQRPDGTAVDLTSLTVKFKMVDAQGNVVLAATSTGVTVTTAASGQCQYDFTAADVDVKGTFYGYFTTTDGSGLVDTFPAKSQDLEIEINPDSK